MKYTRPTRGGKLDGPCLSRKFRGTRKTLWESLLKSFSLDSPERFGYKSFLFAQVAQSVEQRTENPRVGSSILSLGTTNIKGLQLLLQPLFFQRTLTTHVQKNQQHLPPPHNKRKTKTYTSQE